MGCTAKDVSEALRRAAVTVAEHRDELVELDRAIGDADHGENLNRGFTAIVSTMDVDGFAPADPAAVLKAAATTLISKVGGAAGPLYGTAFLRAATAVAGREELDAEAVATALRAAADGVVTRGKAEVGDATMIDALRPAADAAAAAGPVTVSEVLLIAADAADAGAASTAPLVPRKGRASYLGERAVGHVDPGARSTAVILRALAGDR